MNSGERFIDITDAADPRVAVYASLTETQLRAGGVFTPDGQSVFIAESPKVIEVALRAGMRPLSLLCERRHITGDAAGIVAAGDFPVYTGSRQVLESLTGYRLTRGVLCAMCRPAETPAAEVCREARRVAVIDSVCDTTNIGAIFRSAAALGIDAVLLTRGSCDPLNRRAVRVSMGNVFLIPWAWIDDPVGDLHRLGFKTAAMALRQDSVDIDDPALNAEPRLAIILGTEGDGLAGRVIEGADYTVCIPMANGVDSLNVAAASAVAFWQLCRGQ